MCPSSRLWGGLGFHSQFSNFKSTIVRWTLALTLCERVFLFTSPYTCTLCPMFSRDPSVVGLANPQACTCQAAQERTESPDRARIRCTYLKTLKPLSN